MHGGDSKLIDDLGGPTVVGALCRVRPQAVSQWRRKGIPDARRMYLQLLRPEAFEQLDAANADKASDAA